MGDHEELEADGAAACDQHGFASGNASFLHRLQNGVDRLDKRSFLEADVFRECDDAAVRDPRHGFDVFREAATVRSEARGEAGGLVLLALGEEAALAIKTFSAGNVVETHDAVAELPLRDAAANGNNGAGKFVTEDLRRRDVAVEDFFYVGATDAASGDFDEDFAIADFGYGNFLDAHDALFAVDAGAHGFGNGGESLHSLQSCAGPAHRAATS